MATRWFVVLALLLAGCDQLTKELARRFLLERTPHEIIPDFFRITLNYNEGIAWGMLPEWSEYFTYFAIVMVLVILMILRKLDRDEVWLKIALAFQMAGAIGNMSDRLIYHKVTDFLDVTLFPRTGWEYDWPIFNLADSYVVVGTVVLVVVLVFSRDGAPGTEPSEQPVKGGLVKMPDGGGWSEEERLQGSIPVDEGLCEIPTESASEMLVPFEEADSVRAEDLTGPLGNPPDSEEGREENEVREPGSADRKSGLQDLSEGPESL